MKAGISAHGARFLRGLFLLVPGFIVFASASAGPQSQAGFLWIAESQGLLNLATDTGEIRFERPQSSGFSALAVNNVNPTFATGRC